MANFGLTNKYDAARKIEKVIESCKTIKHLCTARAMINNHYSLYKDDYLHGMLLTVWDMRISII